MKFDCGLSAETKRRRREEWAKQEAARVVEWHDHFALWPVRLGDNDCRWLEVVQRRVCRVYAGDFVIVYGWDEMSVEKRAAYALAHSGSLTYEYRAKPKVVVVAFQLEGAGGGGGKPPPRATAEPTKKKTTRKKATKKAPRKQK